MVLYADEVMRRKLGVVSSIYGDFWEESGGPHTHNLPLIGIYKGIFTHVLA